MLPISIRKLKKTDAASLSRLVLKIYDETSYALTFSEKPNALLLMDIFKSKLLLSKNNFLIDLVAVKGKKIIGECEIVLNENNAVIGIIVEKKHRRKGVGKLLIDESIKKFRQISNKPIIAIISKENKTALLFFKKCNFKTKIKEKSDTDENYNYVTTSAPNGTNFTVFPE